MTIGWKPEPVTWTPCHQVKNVLLINDSTSAGDARARDWSGALVFVTSKSAHAVINITNDNAIPVILLVIFILIFSYS